MKKYNKKNVPRDAVLSIHKRFGLAPLESSIFARRNLMCGEDIKYYMESDLRFTHLPFEFANMEDAVSRITDAIEEGEKVLIFGDKDVDGVTSTAILYGYLKSQGLDVQWRIPTGDDSYGLTIEAIDDFIKSTEGYGSLIITVDCGISCVQETAYAKQQGIDVIITDHHNPPEELPDATIIIDPKMPDSGYPFKDISGAAVAYKIVSALRFSKSSFFNQDLTLLNVQEEEDRFKIECLRTRNLVQKKLYSETFLPLEKSIYETRLPDFLRGQQIFVWNEKQVKSRLASVFGNGVDFQLFDLQDEISKLIPGAQGKTLAQIKNLSKIARYKETEESEISGFYNLFVTFAEKIQAKRFPKHEEDSAQDLQLVGIAALADIMPMQNENRIFVKNALSSINGGKTRRGIAELISRMDMAGKKLTSTDLSWKLIPALNASGRMGLANFSVELLLSDDPLQRDKIAKKIIELNEQRKIYVSDGEMITARQAEESFARFNGKLCIVLDERINRGVTGILAAKIMQKYNVPAIALTLSEDKSTAIGSMRSCRDCVATTFLDSFGDFFLNHGGHDAAAGFSFERGKTDSFFKKAEELSAAFNLREEEQELSVDAELPAEYITPELLNTVNLFEPFGEGNNDLIFLAKALKIQDMVAVGKTERQHLKIIFDCGKYKFTGMFWGEGERMNRDFSTGDKVDVLFNITRNTYNGNITPQMILIDMEKTVY
ncbi:MAG: single-stranded-DNA-specific exonuclease RecJ [Treponema sp.]|nr:single-stranded-DNA-specific exonuclease RecJ [Treponema sp.]